eukprot:TRINITY_DN42913_c0_g1_i1.p1 TRINITY_DN42913_c0_g1~~TRINITY_DN42913_c0_g1_i1.p1  ORF type:complete len:421 (-),score=65.22 TRINITY_DN42913_c0_g1_i1:21-1283(-)
MVLAAIFRLAMQPAVLLGMGSFALAAFASGSMVAAEAPSAEALAALEALEVSQRHFACNASKEGVCCPMELCTETRFAEKLSRVRQLQAERRSGGAKPMRRPSQTRVKLPEDMSSRRRQVSAATNMDKTALESFRAALADEGIAVVPNLFNASLCAEAAVAVYKRLQGRSITVNALEFIQQAANRHNLLLDPSEDVPVSRLLNELLTWLSRPLGRVVGVGAPVVELSALVTNPGAKAQDYHRDVHTPRPDQHFAPFITCFVVLRKASSDSTLGRTAGGVQIIPRSHALSPHIGRIDDASNKWFECEDRGAGAECKGRKLFSQWAIDLNDLTAGSLYCYDATAWHRGTAYDVQPSAETGHLASRTVLNVGFYGPGEIVPGPLFNIYPRLIGSYALPKPVKAAKARDRAGETNEQRASKKEL